MPPPREPVYAKDEKALCFHHEFLYEAKVLDSRLSDPTDKKSPLQYRVHYKGWKSTWDDWVPQDRLRKLTEENKQLATNLKREIDDMNPRTAAKSAKSAKKKTAGSDFSSARGSEERQSLPPGRGQKRGRDNEIEKVRSSISSDSSLSRTSPRRITPSKKVLESTEVEEASVSPRKKRPRITLHLSNSPAQLSANNVREQQDGASNKQMPDATATKENLSRLLNDTSGSLVPAERKATEQDIDVNFWAEEAALLDVDFVFGPTKVALAYPKVQLGSTNILTANKPTSKKRARSEVYVPLDQASDSFIANRVSKMLRNKAKTIGDGLDPPWPSERPKGPQRHPKWIHTLHVDSHNHAKLAFYAEILPTDNPVIAGFPPENPPPDLILKPETFSPPNTKRKTKAAPYGHAFDPGDQPATKRMCRRSSSTTDNECQRRIIPGKRNLVEGQAPADDRDTKHIDRNRDNPPKNIQGANDIIQGFQSLKQQLSIQDSDDETNSELEQEEQFHARPAVKIEVPDHLKAILVDDWENVTKNLSLVPIPADHPVSEILSTYFEEEKGKRRLGSAEADLLEEVVQGTKDYFEQCLGKLLLYRFEREQYFRLHQAMEKGKDEFEGRPLKDKKIADIYGAEHLCRLFVSLPELIAQTNMDAQSVSKLRQEIQALTAWLGKNSTRFFTAEYEAAPQEYVEKARGL